MWRKARMTQNQMIMVEEVTLDNSYYQSQATILQEELDHCHDKMEVYLNKIDDYRIENTRLKENMSLLKKFSDSLWDRLQKTEGI